LVKTFGQWRQHKKRYAGTSCRLSKYGHLVRITTKSRIQKDMRSKFTINEIHKRNCYLFDSGDASFMVTCTLIRYIKIDHSYWSHLKNPWVAYSKVTPLSPSDKIPLENLFLGDCWESRCNKLLSFSISESSKVPMYR
jgi:hypothetical protein